MKRSIIRLGIVSMAGLVLFGVSRPAAAAPEGTATWAVHITLASRWLDPAETEGIITPFMFLYALHDAVVKPMPAGWNTPSLAESWSQSKDGLTYDFVLRKGVKFHNGDPVTAEDVKFSFERYRGSGMKLLKERVREVQIVDPGRIRFVLKEPWPDFMTFYGTSATGAGWVVPKKYVEKVGDDGFKKAPIGAGPYKFVSFNPGVELVLEANENYWRKTPSVKRLVLRSMPEETTRAAALKKGEVDIAYLFTGPVAEDIRRTPGLKLTAPNQSSGVFWLDMPDQWDPKSPWHDPRVRLAASPAIDRQALNPAETPGLSKPTGGITGAAGNAATRLEAYVSKEGAYSSGIIPEVEDLFQRQARERDVKRREALIHQIQQILHDRMTHVPIYELAFTWGIGPRLEEPGISLIRGYAYSAPYEDLRLKKP